MAEEKDNRPNQSFNFHGDVKANILNQSGTITFNGGNFTYTEGETSKGEIRAEIEKMIDDLKAKVADEVEDPKEAAKIEVAADNALEVAKEENPDQGGLRIRGDDLMKAAKNIAAVTPIAVEIAKMLLLLK